MKVEVTNEAEGTKEYIDAEKVKSHVRRLIDLLHEKILQGKGAFEEQLKPTIKYWVDSVKEVASTKTVFVDEEFLTKDRLIEVIKQNKANGSNGNILFKTKLANNSVSLLITYALDKQLLPANENVIVNIYAEKGISNEIEQFFGNSDLIYMC